MLTNKDGFVMASRRWLVFAVGLFILLCDVCQAKRTICLPQPIQENVLVLGGMEAGNFKKMATKVKDMKNCLRRACNSQEGNIAFLLKDNCFSVSCHNVHSCELEPAETSGVKTAGALYRVIAAYPAFTGADAVSVLEDTPSLKVVSRFEATAESRTKREETMSYEIVRGNIDRTFRVYPETSNWGSTIRLRKTLDRENISTYGLQIRARNLKENVSSLFNLTITVLDANDNAPQFLRSPFVFTVFSNMSVGSLIGQLVATDNDTGLYSKLKYTINEQSGLITYSQDTGEVRLGQSRTVDTVKTYSYDITVTDGLYTTKGQLNVVLYPNNINRPVFEKISFKVRLNGQVPLDTEVQRVSATDPDYGKLGELTYVILDGDDDGVFTVTSEGVIRTRGKIPLDREVYNLTIGVHDNGYPEYHAITPANVVVLLQWLRFNQDIYETIVQEDLELLQTVFTATVSLWVGGVQVMAGQRRPAAVRDINYYLEGGLERFRMEETSGVITLHEVLDYETRKVYVLGLKADYESMDSTSIKTVLSAKAVLRVEVQDVNDNHPKFSGLHYSQDVWKSSSVDSPVLKMNATDLDEGRNGLIRFEAISGNVNETFSFEPDGMVFLRKPLLHSEHTTFNITVAAWDSGEPTPLRSKETACVTINVRGHLSNSPRFPRDSYSLLISENVDTGFPIYQVNASVVDKRWKLTYWIRDLDGEMPFRVDPGTGWIYTTKRLDREKKALYVLPYMASADLIRTSLTTMVNVTIRLGDENDNRPTFTQPYYSTVLTSHELGMSVLTVQAVDGDEGKNGKVVYSITKGLDKYYFSIDRRSGEITTRRHLPKLSLLALKIYITAKDHGVPSLSSLKPVPVFLYIGLTFNITAQTLERTATTIKLRFTMINVSLAFISHFGVVVQGADSIVDYEEVTKRDLVSWHYVNNVQKNSAYAQRYLTGNVTCTQEIREKKTFDFTVGSDGDKCEKNKEIFCNGKLKEEREYRFQLVAYLKNGTSPKNISRIESIITETEKTGVVSANRTAGFRSWHYDIIVIILAVIVGIIILATILRAFILYRRDKIRMKNDESKGIISYPLSNPRFRNSGTPRSSRSTMSFTELSKSRRLDIKKDKMSPCDTEKLPMTGEEGISPDSGCGVSVKSSNSDVHHRGRNSLRKAFFSFGKNKKDEEQQDEIEEDGSDKEMETELNT